MSEARIPSQPANLLHKASLIEQQWSPRVVAEMNDYQFKVVRIEGEFIWHAHPETDEAFPVSCMSCRAVSNTGQPQRAKRN